MAALLSYHKPPAAEVGHLRPFRELCGSKPKSHCSVLFGRALELIVLHCSSSCSDVRKFKETKKQFDRVREDMEIAQVKNAQAPRNKPHEVEEATGALSISRKCFRHLALDYVLQVSRWRGRLRSDR